MSAPYARELDLAVAVAREAGALLRSRFDQAQEVGYKGRIDLVTRMDLESERLIVERIGAAFPGDDIWAEEGGGGRVGRERLWIVDPLDGTTNYAHGYPVFAVSIALRVAGRLEAGVVYNPLLDEMYAGRRGGGVTLNGSPRGVTTVGELERAMLATGFPYDLRAGDPERNNVGPFSRFVVQAQAVRRAGSAALAIAKVAVGRTDGFWERGLHAWDMAAAALLVEEAGGRVTDYEGRPLVLEEGEIVATNGPLHEAMLRVLAVEPACGPGGPPFPAPGRAHAEGLLPGAAAPAGTRIRPMRRADATAVADLAGQLGYPSTPGQAERRMEAVEGHRPAAALVAEGPGGEVLGWIHVYAVHGLVSDPYAEIGGLVVDEGARCRGVGRTLLAAAEEWAAGQGLREVALRSNVIRVRAHEFYRRLGYDGPKTQHRFRKRLG